MKPKPIPKFKTLNVECGMYLKVHQSQKLWDLGQTKAPVGNITLSKVKWPPTMGWKGHIESPGKLFFLEPIFTKQLYWQLIGIGRQYTCSSPNTFTTRDPNQFVLGASVNQQDVTGTFTKSLIYPVGIYIYISIPLDLCMVYLPLSIIYLHLPSKSSNL